MSDSTERTQVPDDDPFVALAQIRARRAMADVAGFEHHPSWDAIEADALRRLGATDDGSPSPDPALDASAPEDPGPPIDDPLLAFARVTALRIAADSAGVAHDPTWDRTEAAIGDQLHRDAARSVPPSEPEPD